MTVEAQPIPRAQVIIFVSTGFTVSPAAWFPSFNAYLNAGRLADYRDDRLRNGLQWGAAAKLRPLPALELEPRIDAASLRADGAERGGNIYDERATQWLAVLHFDARHTLRAIAQQSRLQRAGSISQRCTESLTYAWRKSSGTQLYIGATRARPGRASEAFIKLQFDADELFGQTS